MWSCLLQRCATAVVLVYVVATIVFLALYMVPGDPAEVLLSADGVAPPAEAVQQMRIKLGLNLPVWKQYETYLLRVGHGDLGTSFTDDAPVIDAVKLRLPRTMELVLASIALSMLTGMPLGIWAAVRHGRWPDRALTFASSVVLSAPVFVIGTLLILLFAQTLHLLPAGGYIAFAANPVQHLIELLMPTIAISLSLASVILRMTRSATLGMLRQDWVRTARAKGLAERPVLLRHVVRNALGPVITIIGLQIGNLLGGTVLVEYVFNWPGLSSMLVDAVENRDYPQVQGTVLFVATLFILINLAVDLLNAALDPRTRAV